VKTVLKDDRKRVALPRYGEYNCVFRYLINKGLDAECVLPPPITRRTLELGAAASPETVCVPYKTLLGSMIEALEAGAEVLVMTSGLCRLGYFGELQEQTLRDMGYEFDFINLQMVNGDLRAFVRELRRKVNPHLRYTGFAKAALYANRMVTCVDRINELYYQTCGFAKDRPACRKLYDTFLKAMYTAECRADIEKAYTTADEALRALPLDKPEHPLRVGIVGEYYTIMDPPSNLHLEQKLADMGVEVWRWLNLSAVQLKQHAGKNLGVRVRDLSRYSMGPNSTENLWCARSWAEQGFDGLIHVKSAACTPEIDTMPLIQQISEDRHIPVLFLTYDTQTSDVGLMTRLEAFYDMIAMKKRSE